MVMKKKNINDILKDLELDDVIDLHGCKPKYKIIVFQEIEY